MFALKTVENEKFKFSSMPFLKATDNYYQMISDLHFSVLLSKNKNYTLNINLIEIEDKKLYLLHRIHKDFITFIFNISIEDLNTRNEITLSKSKDNYNYKLSFHLHKLDNDMILLTTPNLTII